MRHSLPCFTPPHLTPQNPIHHARAWGLYLVNWARCAPRACRASSGWRLWATPLAAARWSTGSAPPPSRRCASGASSLLRYAAIGTACRAGHAIGCACAVCCLHPPSLTPLPAPAMLSLNSAHRPLGLQGHQWRRCSCGAGGTAVPSGSAACSTARTGGPAAPRQVGWHAGLGQLSGRQRPAQQCVVAVPLPHSIWLILPLNTAVGGPRCTLPAHNPLPLVTVVGSVCCSGATWWCAATHTLVPHRGLHALPPAHPTPTSQMARLPSRDYLVRHRPLTKYSSAGGLQERVGRYMAQGGWEGGWVHGHWFSCWQ